MNEAILAYRAWLSLNDHIDDRMTRYMRCESEGGWDDGFLRNWADEICDEYDKLIEVLEWLESKFE